jgi:exonuclease SbcC
MISKIEINNFQSHKHTVIEFYAGVNVIVGASDCGKSAILRALRFVIENRPAGDSVISHWAKQADVSIWVGDDVIRRIKGKSKNEYWLNKTLYKAFGQTVPDDIQKVLNMSDVNIQRQLDGPFLLDDTPGQVATHFNKLANLEKIDTGMRNILSWITKLNQTITSTRAEQKELKEEHKQLSYVKKMMGDVELLERAEQRAGKLGASQSTLHKLTEKTKTVQSDIEKYVIWEVIEKDFKFLETMHDALFTKKEKHAAINNRVDELHIISKRLQKGRKFVRSEKLLVNTLALIERKEKAIKYGAKLYKTIESYASLQNDVSTYKKISLLEGKVNSVLYRTQTANEAHAKKQKLEIMLDKYYGALRNKDVLKLEIKEMGDEFHDQFPNQCPLCDSIIEGGAA